MQSKKLYFDNSYTKEFDADIIEVSKYKDSFAVILDKTAFYPESGGQPADMGFIGGIPIIHVIEENGSILHIAKNAPNKGRVRCSIDWQRRFEHMQQHTGQHILSACFYKLYGGNTSSFTIGNESSTIEIDISHFDAKMASELEDIANSIVYDNIPVKANIVEADTLKTLPLRKLPKVSTNIRVVEVQDTDFSPCGGTHVNLTGEIGIIKVKRWEKLKSSYKFEFVCGTRALKDYRAKNTAINNLASTMSARDYEVENYFNKLIEDYKALQKDFSAARQALLSNESEKLMNTALTIQNIKIVSMVFKDRDISDLKILAQNIIKHNSYIVLSAVINQSAQILFSCSDDLSINMGTLLKSVIHVIDGKGGGNAKSAQGGGSNTEALDLLMSKAEQLLVAQINNK